MITALMLASMALGSALSHWWVLATQIILTAVMMTLQVRHARRLRSKIVAAAGRVCIHCSYTLASLPAPGVCPECGRAYPEDGYAAVWVRAWPQALGKYSNMK